MKKGLYVTLISLCLSGVSAQENEEIKLSGLYLGVGIHNNFDKANVKYDGDTQYDIYIFGHHAARANKGDKIASCTDFNYGVHIVAGGSYIFDNNIFVSLEQQIGIQHHPSKTKVFISDEQKNSITKGCDFITLARLGYKFNSFPGIAYISTGMHVLNIDYGKDSKNICRPVFGIGYQHGLSEHWSIRGDVLYTHISSIKNTIKFDIPHFENMSTKSNGHRISARVTLAYTF